AAVAELLADHDLVEHAEAQAADLLGDADVEQADLVRLRHDLLGVGLVAVVLGRYGDHVVADEVARQRLELLLLGRELEVDHASPLLPPRSRRVTAPAPGRAACGSRSAGSRSSPRRSRSRGRRGSSARPGSPWCN